MFENINNEDIKIFALYYKVLRPRLKTVFYGKIDNVSMLSSFFFFLNITGIVKTMHTFI